MGKFLEILEFDGKVCQEFYEKSWGSLGENLGKTWRKFRENVNGENSIEMVSSIISSPKFPEYKTER